MSRSVDERVVEMRFDNQQFEQNVKTTMNTLDKLKQSLHLDGATKGLENVDRAAKGVDLSAITMAVESIQSRFSTLGIIGMRVLQNLTDSAMQFAGKVTGFVTNGIVQGGISRAMNIEQAKFQLNGLKVAWDDIVKDIDYAVKDTAYGMDSAAKAASQLVASGVQFGETFGDTGNSPMAKALRGISGVAAMTNSSYDDIARVFTTVAGNGRLMGDQLNQLGARGLNAAAILGEALGKTETEIRQMVSKSQIDFQTFAAAMDDAFGQHAKDADKTFTGVMSNIRAALARIGANFISPLIVQEGPLVQFLGSIKSIINGINNQLGGLQWFTTTKITETLYSFAEMLKPLSEVYADESGRKVYVNLYKPFEAFYNVVRGLIEAGRYLGSIGAQIKKAFVDAVPKPSIDAIVALTKSFEDFMKNMKLSERDTQNFYDTFHGLFSILDTGKQILGAIVRAIFPATSAFKGFGSGILEVTGQIGRWLSSINEFLKQNDAFEKAIQGIKSVVGPVFEGITEVIRGAATALKEFFTAKFELPDFSSLSSAGEKLKAIFSGIKNVVADAWENVKSFFKSVSEIISGVTPAFKAFGDAVSQIFSGIGNAFQTGDFKYFMNLLTSGLLATLIGSLTKTLLEFVRIFTLKDTSNLEFVTMFKEFFNEIKFGFGLTGATTKFKYAMDELKTSLKSFEKAIAVDSLLKIAAAVGVLAISLIALSHLDADALAVGLGGVSALLGETVATLKVLSSLNIASSPAKLSALTAAIVGFAIAMSIMAGALKKLQGMRLEEMLVGVAAIGAMVFMLVEVAKNLNRESKGMLTSAISMVIFAEAVKVLAKSVKMLGEMDIKQLMQGLIGVTIILGEIVALTRLGNFEGMGLGTGLAMMGIASAIKTLADVVNTLGNMRIEAAIQGIGALGIILLELAAFTRIVSGSEKILSVAIAMVIMGGALEIIADVLTKIGAIPFDDLTKSVLVMTAALVGITAALVVLSNGAQDSLKGAISFLIVAGSLQLVANALMTVGQLSWSQIASSLIAFTVVLGLLMAALVILSGANTKLTDILPFVVLVASLQLVANALATLGEMTWDQIAASFIALSSTVLILVGVLIALSAIKVSVSDIVPFLALVLSLRMIADVMIDLAQLSFAETAVALIALVGAMTVVFVALTALTAIGPSALAGAGAMLLVGIALQSIVPVLLSLSTMSWEEVGRGLLALGGALAILTVVCGTLGVIGTPALIGAGILLAIGVALGVAGLAIGLGVAAIVGPVTELIDLFEKLTLIDSAQFNKTMTEITPALMELAVALGVFTIPALIGGAAMKDVADAIFKMAPALVMLSTVEPDKLAVTLEKLADGFEQFGHSLDSFGLFAGVGASAMLKVGTAIGIMAPGIVKLAEMEPPKVALVLSTLSDAFKSFGEALESTPFWGAKSRAEGIGILVDQIETFVEAIPKMADLKSVDVQASMGVLSDAFVSFGQSLSEAPMWFAQSRAEGIGILVENIGVFADAVPKLKDIDSDTVDKVLETLGKAFLTFGQSISSAPLFNADERGEGIATLVSSLDDLSAGIKKFQTELNQDDIEDQFETIALAFDMFGGTIRRAPLFGAEERSDAIMNIVNSLDTLADGVTRFMRFSDIDKFKTVMTTIGDGMKDFGTAVSNAPLFNAEERSTAIANLVDSLDSLADGVTRFMRYSDIDKFKTVMTTIGDGMKSLGASLKETPFWNAEERGQALSSVIDSLQNLAPVLYQLGGLGDGIASKAIGNIGDLLETLAMAVGAFTEYQATNLSSISGTLADLSPTLQNLSDVTSNDFIGRINRFRDAIINFITAFEGLDAAMEQIKTLSAKAVEAFSAGLRENEDDLSNEVKSLADTAIKKLKDSLPDDSIEKIGNGVIDALMSGMSNKLDALKTKIWEICEALLGAYEENLQTEIVEPIGNDVITSINEGMKAKLEDLTTVAKDICDKLLCAFEEGLPKEDVSGIGEDVVNNVCFGLAGKASADRINVSAAVVTGLVVKNFEDGLKRETFYNLGANATQGLIDGLNSKQRQLNIASNALANSVSESTRKALNERSPSKVMFKIGEFATQGLLNGLNSLSNNVTKAGADLGNNAIDSVRRAIQDASTMVEDDMDSTPVITPVLDLSDVQNGVRQINGLFGSPSVSAYAYNTAQEIARNDSFGSVTVNPNAAQAPVANYNFTQNNYSPKALSRSEIYRQTRNQITAMRGAVSNT